jgi:hypothetical protein
MRAGACLWLTAMTRSDPSSGIKVTKETTGWTTVKYPG